MVKSKEANARIYVLGKNPDSRIIKEAGNDPNIIFTGFVQDLDDYLKKTRVYLAPLRFGSGMKVKVLEGLYRGVPSVVTSVGAEGLEINHEQQVLIADDPKEFAKQCIRLLEDEQLWNSIRDESRTLAANQYRWESLFKQMDKSLLSLIKK